MKQKDIEARERLTLAALNLLIQVGELDPGIANLLLRCGRLDDLTKRLDDRREKLISLEVIKAREEEAV